MAQGFSSPQIDNKKDLLAEFDKNAKEARALLKGVSDQQLMKDWILLAGGKAIFTMARVACIRGMMMNHVIHHRAQLTVYFRLLRVPVPGLYGPSAGPTRLGCHRGKLAASESLNHRAPVLLLCDGLVSCISCSGSTQALSPLAAFKQRVVLRTNGTAEIVEWFRLFGNLTPWPGNV